MLFIWYRCIFRIHNFNILFVTPLIGILVGIPLGTSGLDVPVCWIVDNFPPILLVCFRFVGSCSFPGYIYVMGIILINYILFFVH